MYVGKPGSIDRLEEQNKEQLIEVVLVETTHLLCNNQNMSCRVHRKRVCLVGCIQRGFVLSAAVQSNNRQDLPIVSEESKDILSAASNNVFVAMSCRHVLSACLVAMSCRLHPTTSLSACLVGCSAVGMSCRHVLFVGMSCRLHRHVLSPCLVAMSCRLHPNMSHHVYE